MRLPNESELKDLYDNIYSPRIALFPSMVSASYITARANGTFNVNIVHMGTGITSNLQLKSTASPVLCVRDGL
ncbi:MAG: hypothetical protein IPL26_16855 [Leptospiraceae bacterium]|nr:hypothetical protein [Leptospiraceae bacterium]